MGLALIVWKKIIIPAASMAFVLLVYGAWVSRGVAPDPYTLMMYIWLDFYKVLMVGIAIEVLLLTPGIIASRRGNPCKNYIFYIGHIFGITVIGWFAAMIWALLPIQNRIGDGMANGLQKYGEDVATGVIEGIIGSVGASMKDWVGKIWRR